MQIILKWCCCCCFFGYYLIIIFDAWNAANKFNFKLGNENVTLTYHNFGVTFTDSSSVLKCKKACVSASKEYNVPSFYKI